MVTTTPSLNTTSSTPRRFIRIAFWPLFVILLEQLVPKNRGAGIVRDPQLRQDLTFFLLVTLVEIITNLALIASALGLGAQLQSSIGFSLWPAQWPWPAQAVLAFFAVDLFD